MILWPSGGYVLRGGDDIPRTTPLPWWTRRYLSMGVDVAPEALREMEGDPSTWRVLVAGALTVVAVGRDGDRWRATLHGCRGDGDDEAAAARACHEVLRRRLTAVGVAVGPLWAPGALLEMDDADYWAWDAAQEPK